MADTTHPYVGHNSPICGTRLTHVWDRTHPCVGHDSPIYGTRLTHIWDTTYPYVGHDSPKYDTCLVRTWNMTHSYVSGIRTVHNTTHIRDMTNLCTWEWLFFHNAIQLQPHGGKNHIVLYQEMWLQSRLHVSKLLSAATSQRFNLSGPRPGTWNFL